MKIKAITAEEARVKSNAVLNGRVDEELALIYRLIESACDQGEKEIFLDKPLKPTLSDRLEILGYKVNTSIIFGWSRIYWY